MEIYTSSVSNPTNREKKGGDTSSGKGIKGKKGMAPQKKEKTGGIPRVR